MNVLTNRVMDVLIIRLKNGLINGLKNVLITGLKIIVEHKSKPWSEKEQPTNRAPSMNHFFQGF